MNRYYKEGRLYSCKHNQPTFTPRCFFGTAQNVFPCQKTVAVQQCMGRCPCQILFRHLPHQLSKFFPSFKLCQQDGFFLARQMLALPFSWRDVSLPKMLRSLGAEVPQQPRTVIGRRDKEGVEPAGAWARGIDATFAILQKKQTPL